MKNFYASLIFLAATLTGCAGTKITQVGEINMISQRNVESKAEYVAIKSYAGGGKEIKNSNARTIQEAVDQTVRGVPGGEFLKNAKIYHVDGKYWAVEGDVWGLAQGEYRGFHLGDRVQWKTLTGTHVGVIKGFINEQRCMVQEDGKSAASEEQYDKLRKIQ